MPEQKRYPSRKEQEKLKPPPEDLIPEYLDSEMKALALDFVTYIRDNKMSFRWVNINGWQVNYKGERFCGLVLSAGEARPEGPISWVVSVTLNRIDKYEAMVMNEGLADFVWDTLHYCNGCPVAGNPRVPARPCFGGRNITLLGREYKGVCHQALRTKFFDPDGAAIGNIKRLLMLEKKARDEESEALKCVTSD